MSRFATIINLFTMRLQFILTLFIPFATAFVTTFYANAECKSENVAYTKEVSDGCQTDRPINFSGMINYWEDHQDNFLLLVTYSDKSCCHANTIQTFDWEDGCQAITGDVQSWRIVSSDDWDRGKAGESYSCLDA